MNRNKSLRIFVPRGMKAVIEETDNMEEVKMQIIEDGKAVQTINLPISSTPHNKNDTPANGHGSSNDPRDKQRFLKIRVKDGYRIINMDEIMWIKGDDAYSCIYMVGEDRIYTSKTLSHIQKTIGDHRLVRIHKSYMVNLNFAKGFFGNEVVIYGHNIPIGRMYKKQLYELIKTL